jgi:hypothetical protein
MEQDKACNAQNGNAQEVTVLPKVLQYEKLSNTADLENAVKTAERTEELIRKIKTLAIKQTNKYDWIDMQGKPYLQSSGAEKVARLFGISWRVCAEYPKKETIADENGSYYMYVYKGEFMMGGKAIEVVGTCSQKDKFLGTQGAKNRPLSEIDEGNIIKKAYTNMVGRGITTILGIRNLTWDEINSGGIDRNTTSKVNYAQGSKGGKATTEIIGIVRDLKVKEGTSKTGKAYKILAFNLTDKNGQIHHINTFDNKEILDGFEVKAAELEAKEYKGTVTYVAKRIEIASELCSDNDSIGG